MIELIVFTLPVLVILNNVYQRFANPYESAQEAFRKMNMPKPTDALPAAIGMPSFFFAPLFISYGWLWALFAAIITTSRLIMLFVPKDRQVMPDTNSKSYQEVVVRRKQKTIWAVLIVGFWSISWVV